MAIDFPAAKFEAVIEAANIVANICGPPTSSPTSATDAGIAEGLSVRAT